MYHQIQSYYKGELGEIRFSSVGLVDWYFGSTRTLSLKYVVSGKENYVLGGKQFEVNPHEMLLFSKGQPYTAYTEDSQSNNGFCIDLNDDFIKEARRDVFGEKLLFDLEEDFKAIKLSSPSLNFQHEMLQLFEGIKVGEKLKMEESLSQLMGLYLDLEGDFSQKIKAIPTLKNNVKKEVFRKLLLAQSYIHDNKYHCLNLNEIALASGLSKFYLQRLFSKVFGMSPSQYLESLKMQEALTLLKTKSQSISAIGYSLGFKDLAYFSRRFKRYFGYAPRELQKKL